MKSRTRSTLFIPALLLSLSSFTACSSTPAPTPVVSTTISGTVYAPSGGNINGTIVLLCFVTGETCDESKSEAVTISSNGSSATYITPNLVAGNYAVFALQGQLDQNNDLTSLDTLGVYARGANNGATYTTVRPPASGIDVKLLNLSNPDAGGNPVSPEPATAIPTTLQAEFFVGSPSPTTYYSPSTGAFAPSSGTFQSYVFNADGSFVQSALLQSSFYSCTTAIFIYDTGQTQINGSQMTLNITGGQVKYTNSCSPEKNYDRPSKLRSQQYTWRVANDLDSPSITYLYLKDAQGNEPRYVQKK
jgi:hypothetical protein